MNQYVVYALTRQAEAMHALVATTPAERQEARQRWDDLRKRLGSHPTDEAVRAALHSREPVEPEPDLSPAARDLILRLEGNPATADAELHK